MPNALIFVLTRRNSRACQLAIYAEFDCTLGQIEYRVLQRFADEDIDWQRVISNALKLYGKRKEQREMELLTLSAEERYLRFVQEHPALVSVLRQRDIASYIRVTPVALSRIKSRLVKNGKLIRPPR